MSIDVEALAQAEHNRASHRDGSECRHDWFHGSAIGPVNRLDAEWLAAEYARLVTGHVCIDVEALTNAVFYVYGNVTKRGPSIGPDRPGPREGHRPREFWEEDARLIAAEYARLVPAEDEGRLREALLGYVIEYDREERWLVATDEDGASQIIAMEVVPEFGYALAATPEPGDTP